MSEERPRYRFGPPWWVEILQYLAIPILWIVGMLGFVWMVAR